VGREDQEVREEVANRATEESGFSEPLLGIPNRTKPGAKARLCLVEMVALGLPPTAVMVVMAPPASIMPPVRKLNNPLGAGQSVHTSRRSGVDRWSRGDHKCADRSH
jgi:hypothetical protein